MHVLYRIFCIIFFLFSVGMLLAQDSYYEQEANGEQEIFNDEPYPCYRRQGIRFYKPTEHYVRTQQNETAWPGKRDDFIDDMAR